MIFPTRNQIFDALFNLVAASYPFATASRRLRLWDDVPAEERPALFMQEGREESNGGERGTPSIRFYNLNLFVYVSAKDAEVPVRELDEILDAIDNALTPNPLSGFCDLGGLVNQVWAFGTTIKIPGDLDGDGIAIIPLRIRVP